MSLYEFLLGICSFLLRILYRIEVEGEPSLERDKAYIIAANHISYLDPIVVAMVFSDYRVHFLGKKELFKGKFLSKLFSSIGVIPVDRSKNDITAVKNVMRLLKNNKILGIFPQGTRIRKEEEDRSKAGLGMFAIKTGTDIVPVTVQSTYKPFSKVKVIVHDLYRVNEEYKEQGAQAYLQVSHEVMNIIKG